MKIHQQSKYLQSVIECKNQICTLKTYFGILWNCSIWSLKHIGFFWTLLDPFGPLWSLWTLVDPYGPLWTLWKPMEYLLRHFRLFLNHCVLQQFSNKAPASPPVVVIMSRSNNADKTPLSFWKILRPFFKGTMMTSYLIAEQIPFWPFFLNQGQVLKENFKFTNLFSRLGS